MVLSIIIPIFNKESFVEECLQSLINQDVSADKYQVICVDDGSTDKTRDIVNKYAKKYQNITYAYKDNGGVSSARNVGLNIAKGDYIWFVDPDDYVQNDILNNLCNLLSENRYDRLRLGFIRFLDDTKVFNKEMEFVDETVWGSVLKKKIIDDFNIRFDESTNHQEDTLFMLNYIVHEKNVCDFRQLCYYYRINNQSITAEKTNYNKHRGTTSYINSTIQMKKLYDEYNDDFGCSKEFILTRLLYAMRVTFNNIAQYPPSQARKYLKIMKDAGAYPFTVPPKSKKYTKTFDPNRIKNSLILHSTTRLGFALLYIYYLPDITKNCLKIKLNSCRSCFKK